MRNEYLPYPAKIRSVYRESKDVNTLQVVFEDRTLARSFTYKPGQFMQISLLGIGEAPISITSSPTQREYLEFTIRGIGKLTRTIIQLKPGDKIYMRGPYGNSFPFEEIKNRDLYFIAGGIGLPPLRSLINAVFERREDFGKVRILYGAKTPAELCFKKELMLWGDISNTEVLLTVDKSDKAWKGNVGVVTALCDKTDISASCGAAFICGPPIMIRFALEKLRQAGFEDNDIYISLERYMKCGIGKCGHCNIGEKFVCTEGPVFSYTQLKKIPEKETVI